MAAPELLTQHELASIVAQFVDTAKHYPDELANLDHSTIPAHVKLEGMFDPASEVFEGARPFTQDLQEKITVAKNHGSLLTASETNPTALKANLANARADAATAIQGLHDVDHAAQSVHAQTAQIDKGFDAYLTAHPEDAEHVKVARDHFNDNVKEIAHTQANEARTQVKTHIDEVGTATRTTPKQPAILAEVSSTVSKDAKGKLRSISEKAYNEKNIIGKLGTDIQYNWNHRSTAKKWATAGLTTVGAFIVGKGVLEMFRGEQKDDQGNVVPQDGNLMKSVAEVLGGGALIYGSLVHGGGAKAMGHVKI